MGFKAKQIEQRRGKLILVHWHDEEWEELAKPLRTIGWQIQQMQGASGLRREDPEEERPVAVLISLRRLPSHGREVAGAIWYPLWARETIRIVFFDGKPEAVAITRSKFPTATFTSYDALPKVLDLL